MLSIGLCDHIDIVSNNAYIQYLMMTRFGNYYYWVNVFSLNLSQSYNIKRLVITTMTAVRCDHR
jgi:hypothetical protein